MEVFTARPARALGRHPRDRINWSARGLACENCGALAGVTPDHGEWSGRAAVSLQFNGYINGTLCDRCRSYFEIAESGE